MYKVSQSSSELPPVDHSENDANEVCKACGGQRFVYRMTGKGDRMSDYKLVRCSACNPLVNASGLSLHEQVRFDGIVAPDYDYEGVVIALLWAGAEMIRRRFGFATLYGGTGAVKSMWARALVTEACHADIEARYIHAVDLEQSFFSNGDAEEVIVPSQLMAVKLLVIDECQLINWNNPWVMARMHKLIDSRYRQASVREADQRLMTVMVAQKAPALWSEAGAEWLLSRVMDGRFAMVWPDAKPVPKALTKRPCVCGNQMHRSQGNRMECGCGYTRPIEMYWPFQVSLPDVRPVLPPFKDN